jgi:aryl-alcohol dehydrogenase-like predicted oxidoreductase
LFDRDPLPRWSVGRTTLLGDACHPQAGALTSAIDRPLATDHPEMRDFVRAAGFRRLAEEFGATPAALAHRYALSLDIDTLVLGVKNRKELAECLAAADAGPLPRELMARVDQTLHD